MAAIEKVKVLIAGDSGVGKTSLIHLICHNEPIANPYWTIGCSLDCKLHEYKQGTAYQKDYFIELWDIGGWSAHSNSRSIFYAQVHGIILVHDLTNRKTEQNLRKWWGEILNKEDSEIGSYDPELSVGSQIPILVIGSKYDLSGTIENTNRSKKRSLIADEYGTDEILMDCTQVKYLQPGTTNAVTLSRFFDKVIESRYYSRENNIPFSPPTFNFMDKRKNTKFD